MVIDEAWLKAHTKEDANGCWIWQKYIDERGYGRLKYQQKSFRAHQFVYMHFIKPRTPGLIIRHLCNNPSCVKPKHLVEGSSKENTADMRKDLGKHPSAKLTEEQVKSIKESKLTQMELGAMYGVTHGAIGFIKRGVTWVRS